MGKNSGASSDADEEIDKEPWYELYKAVSETEESHLYTGEEAPGFDVSTGKTWKYPINYPKRNYQFHIIEKAIYENTLVCLPTGLGKTFIAAVVMYNYFRWYPQGKIIFMAPTKPLVLQQVQACSQITGLPSYTVTILTGLTNPDQRLEEWQTKRVFFCTPQILNNDVSNKFICPKAVTCVVVDEAHRATRNHVYVQVIKKLVSESATFRILALSATPGSNFQMIQEVINNLHVSRIETRTETSPDVAPYTHKRNIETVVVKTTGYLKHIIDKFMSVIEIYVRPLIQSKLLSGTVRTLAKYKIVKMWEQIRNNPPHHISSAQLSSANGDFAVSISLFHALELLTLHGLRSFVKYVKGLLISKDQPLVKRRLLMCASLQLLINELQTDFGGDDEFMMSDPDQPSTSKNTRRMSHPKFEKLEGILQDHFRESNSSDTKAIVFCQYRDTVIEACNMLKIFEPRLRPVAFMGQSAARKTTFVVTQKHQQEVLKKFRLGDFNILISTCVGEEGLDVGEVDLVVCFDAYVSPVRFIQRIGRTGRKRQGRIVMLLTEGLELQRYTKSLNQQDAVNKAIVDTKLILCHNSPRMVPNGLNPECHEIKVILDTEEVKGLRTVKRKMETKRKIATDLKSMWAKSPKNSEGIKANDSEKEEIKGRPQVPGDLANPALLHSMEEDPAKKSDSTNQQIQPMKRKRSGNGKQGQITKKKQKKVDSEQFGTQETSQKLNSRLVKSTSCSTHKVVQCDRKDETETKLLFNFERISEFARAKFDNQRDLREGTQESLMKVCELGEKDHGFINLEPKVSVSSYSLSEDEKSESKSEYEASFVNDSSSEESDSVDMAGKYLQSVRSPMKGRGKFKIPKVIPKKPVHISSSDNDDEFSNTYARDSFCVDDDEGSTTNSDYSEPDVAEIRHQTKTRPMCKVSSKKWTRIEEFDSSSTDSD